MNSALLSIVFYERIPKVAKDMENFSVSPVVNILSHCYSDPERTVHFIDDTGDIHGTF